MSRVQKLPHVKEEPLTDGSRSDPLLARAEAMGDAGLASVRTDIRKGEKNLF